MKRSNRLVNILCVLVMTGFTANAIAANPAAASPSTWSVTASPNKGAEDQITGVSCASASDCFAVGSYQNGTGAGKVLIESWNGTNWALEPSPKVKGSDDALQGVDCTSSSFCIAVGYYDTTSYDQTLVEIWNGISWSVLSSPDPSTTGANQFTAVDCVAENTCLAVGNTWMASQGTPGNEVPLIAWLNRGTWSIQSSPRIGAAAVFDAVSCVSTKNCSAVGYSIDGEFGVRSVLAESLSGTTWTIDTTPTSNDATSGYTGIYCSRANYCMAVGSKGQGNGGPPQTLVSTWNGSTWSDIASADRGKIAELSALSCLGKDDCVTVGWYGKTLGSPAKTLVESWDGKAWSVTPSPSRAGDNYLNGVWCSTAHSCQAVGYSDSGSGSASSATLAEVGKT